VRYFRRLPPLLRVATILGLVLPLASLALLLQMLPTKLSTSAWPADFDRVMAMVLSLNFVGMSCNPVVAAYSTRFRHPERGVFPLESWPSQVRALVIIAALPLSALAWAVFIPLTQPGFYNVFLIDMLAAGVLIVAVVWVAVRYQAVD
jgi:hypothetical protein